MEWWAPFGIPIVLYGHVPYTENPGLLPAVRRTVVGWNIWILPILALIDAFNSVICAILKSNIIILKSINPLLSNRVQISIEVLSDTFQICSKKVLVYVALYTHWLTWHIPFFE